MTSRDEIARTAPGVARGLGDNADSRREIKRLEAANSARIDDTPDPERIRLPPTRCGFSISAAVRNSMTAVATASHGSSLMALAAGGDNQLVRFGHTPGDVEADGRRRRHERRRRIGLEGLDAAGLADGWRAGRRPGGRGSPTPRRDHELCARRRTRSERSEIEAGATGEPFADALLTDGRTWLGLPDEYREAVRQVLSRVEQSLPVRTTVAAHHEVGSSLTAFYEATTALVVALAAGEPALGRTGDALWKLMDDEVVANPFHR